MYYNMFLLLLPSVMMALAEGWPGNTVHECTLTKDDRYNSSYCDVFSVISPVKNQECRANIGLSLNIPLYLKIGNIFDYMEIAITTLVSHQPFRIKIEKIMFGNEHDWHHTELREEIDGNGYTYYSVYINHTFKKSIITYWYKVTKIEVYFKGYPYYAVGCIPVPNVPLIKPTPPPTPTTTPTTTTTPTPPPPPPTTTPTTTTPTTTITTTTTTQHWTTPSPSLPTPTNGDIDTDSKEYQPDQEGYSPVFIISVSAGVVGVVLLITIAVLCYFLCKGDQAQPPLQNETEIISFHNNQQHLSPQHDPMEDDPETHIYCEVSDLGPVASVGARCDNDNRGSAHESVNSLYASFDYYMEDK
ncbi:hypothetical protein Pmani_023093 [Petrolisthes manimaculis]|uniref:Uncharacterized protein n=1 Tax=Petrolisthes manimaculis TaxID=1843537 RepID=A0AAE1PAS8_9EUCA|nr:hypothetical protein Pmani_023093 [Petrolisthes manimaculis]